MRHLSVLFLVALAACATPAPAPSELTNVQLCEAFFYAGEPYAAQAGQEATNRGVRCVEYRDAVAQYRQGRNAVRAEAAREVLLSRPLIPPLTYQPAPVIQPGGQINCTSYRLGNTVHTNCN